MFKINPETLKALQDVRDSIDDEYLKSEEGSERQKNLTAAYLAIDAAIQFALGFHSDRLHEVEQALLG